MDVTPDDSTIEQDTADTGERAPTGERTGSEHELAGPEARRTAGSELEPAGVEAARTAGERTAPESPLGIEARIRRGRWSQTDAASRAATRERVVPWWANAGDDAGESPPIDPAQALAAFYDRRAPAALAYCARACGPESIADAVEEAFGKVFETAALSAERLDDDQLDRLLRDNLRAAAADRGPATRGRRAARRRTEEAERAYEALCGDDAPGLGRSLLGEMIEAEPFAWPEQSRASAKAPAAREPAAAAALQAETAAAAPETSEAETPAAGEARRRRPRIAPGWRRRTAIVMAVVGTLLLAEAAVTLAWKEPLTAYLAARSQDDLDKQLDDLGRQKVALGADEQRSLAAIHDAGARTKKRMAILAGRLDDSVPEGEALGRIQIDRIDIDFVFVQGTDGASLRKGPGHYDQGRTVLPGEEGVVGIAGHRTTYEAPFSDVDELKTGDRITLRMPYGVFTYEVTGRRIVPADYPHAFTTDEAGSGERLVLSACHPRYSSEQRILIDSKLVASRPLGSAIDTTTVPAVPGPTARQLALRRRKARLERLGDRQLAAGATGDDVRELQRLLGMPITGTFDPNTTAAVLAFQRDHELPQVGTVGPETKRALARQPHLPSRPPTPADVPEQQAPGPTGTQGQQPNGYGGYQGGGSGSYTQPTP
jgi:sortase A